MTNAKTFHLVASAALALGLGATAVSADMLGRDADDRAVILRSDGTWAYLDARFDGDAAAMDPASGHIYARSADRATWSEARAACNGAGGHLAAITSAAENAFVAGQFDGAQRIWLGGTDEVREGQWRWITGETWGFAGWGEDEPNDNDGGEDYLELGDDGRWNDDGLPKSDREFHYLCEFE